MFNFFNMGSKKKYVCDHSCEEFDQGDIIAKFFKALCHHDKNRIKELLKEGADINCISPVGVTPLTYCAANNDLEMMIFLIKNKADVKIRDTTDCTPFSYACKVSNIKMMKYLLKYTDLKSEYEADPKLIFSLISENIPEPLNFLVNAGFEINNVNHLGYTPLMSAIFRNNVKIAITLLNNNADVNIKANNGKTALMYAIELQNKWLVKLLIQKGADLKAVDEEGLDAKAYARRTENHDFIRFFDYYVKISKQY